MVKCGDWGCTPNPYSSHINVIYKRCLTTFICCGCAYGCVPTTLWPLVPTKLVEFCHKSGQVSDDMWEWKAMIEAVDPTHTHLTSLLYIYDVFDNLYMLWMCIWMCPHTHYGSPIPENWHYSGRVPGLGWCHIPIHSLSRCKSTLYIYNIDLWSISSGVWGSTIM